jgi:hypothetical protein
MKQLLYFGLITTFLVAASCDLEETNINPNDPIDVPVETLLPPAQQRIGEIMAGDAAVIAGIFNQYFIGFEALVQPIEKYVVDNDFFIRPIWSDFYVTVFPTLDIIIQKAEEQDLPHYEGVGKTLMALTVGTATSLWGDIPFSEGFEGPEILRPVYDSQDDIYEDLQQLLDDAIADFDRVEGTISSSDDLLLNWDIDNWKKVAYTLKARYYMHTIKRDADAPSKALTALAKGIQSSSEDLVYSYNEQEFNPWFRYIQATPNIRIDDFFLDLIDDDPREKAMVKSTFGEKNLGPYYASEFSLLALVSYVEAKLLEAEALVRTQQSGAQEALDEAVQIHIETLEPEATEQEINDYLAANTILSGDQDANLEIILTQKYIAQFTTIEGWSDFRRTGFPELNPNPEGNSPQNPNGEIPRRFPYPLNEELYNPNVPSPIPTLRDRFWWDQ